MGHAVLDISDKAYQDKVSYWKLGKVLKVARMPSGFKDAQKAADLYSVFTDGYHWVKPVQGAMDELVKLVTHYYRSI